MAKKEVKPVASGVDLSGLSCAQLKALSVEATVRANEIAEKEGKAAIKALKASGELDAFKKEWAAIIKEGKALARPAKFDLVLPIRFTMTTDGPDTEEVFNGYEDEADFFSHSFSATILKEGGNLTNKQRKALEYTVDDYATNACEDIYDVLPEGLMAHYLKWTEKAAAFVKKAKEASVGLEDLA
jgi:hypothetical protein